MFTGLLYAFLFILALNMLAYVFAFKWQTDHLTDITYNITFFLLAVFLWWKAGDFGLYKTVLMLMLVLWSIRLGGFLLYRVQKMGRDRRFDTFRESRTGFLKFWVLQSVSIWIIAIPFIIAFQNSRPLEFGFWEGLGASLWLLGWIMESTADWQKFVFRQNKANEGKVIQSGMYTRIRHPNYTGEIFCWLGIFFFVLPLLNSWEWVAVVSPLWIISLLVFISGIPLIEKSRQKKYGNDPEYQTYFKKSWRLIPYFY